MIRNIQRISALAAMIAVLWVLYADSPVEYGCLDTSVQIAKAFTFNTSQTFA